MTSGGSCSAAPIGPGIVARLAGWLADAGANIVVLDVYSTQDGGGVFFLRAEFVLEGLADAIDGMRSGFEPIAAEFEMTWRLTPSSARKRVAIFVSRYDHCLLDLLWRWRRDELHMDVVAVVSNHEDLRAEVEAFGVAFHHIRGRARHEAPGRAGADRSARRHGRPRCDGPVHEDPLRRLPRSHRCPGDQRPSLLPAGVRRGRSLRSALARGVKLIGATAHYATEDLDEGPIIEQAVRPVSHRADPRMLEMIGRDIERTVFARAVHWHLEDRILTYGNRAIVFWPG